MPRQRPVTQLKDGQEHYILTDDGEIVEVVDGQHERTQPKRKNEDILREQRAVPVWAQISGRVGLALIGGYLALQLGVGAIRGVGNFLSPAPITTETIVQQPDLQNEYVRNAVTTLKTYESTLLELIALFEDHSNTARASEIHELVEFTNGLLGYSQYSGQYAEIVFVDAKDTQGIQDTLVEAARAALPLDRALAQRTNWLAVMVYYQQHYDTFNALRDAYHANRESLPNDNWVLQPAQKIIQGLETLELLAAAGPAALNDETARSLATMQEGLSYLATHGAQYNKGKNVYYTAERAIDDTINPLVKGCGLACFVPQAMPEILLAFRTALPSQEAGIASPGQ